MENLSPEKKEYLIKLELRTRRMFETAGMKDFLCCARDIDGAWVIISSPGSKLADLVELARIMFANMAKSTGLLFGHVVGILLTRHADVTAALLEKAREEDG